MVLCAPAVRVATVRVVEAVERWRSAEQTRAQAKARAAALGSSGPLAARTYTVRLLVTGGQLYVACTPVQRTHVHTHHLTRTRASLTPIVRGEVGWGGVGCVSVVLACPPPPLPILPVTRGLAPPLSSVCCCSGAHSL